MFWMVFFAAFLLMEFAAWAAHKYLMHGFFWFLHEDHHRPNSSRFQKNDAFALFFAIPSFVSILIGEQFGPRPIAGFGYGVMAYGMAYFFVHEIIIHRRYQFFRGKGWYFTALIMAHREHHKVMKKEGADHFGMLWVKPYFFRLALSRAKTRPSASSIKP